MLEFAKIFKVILDALKAYLLVIGFQSVFRERDLRHAGFNAWQFLEKLKGHFLVPELNFWAILNGHWDFEAINLVIVHGQALVHLLDEIILFLYVSQLLLLLR